MAAPFLIKRRAGWSLRIRIPSAFHPILGTHLTRSLKTRDHNLARRRAVLAAAGCKAVGKKRGAPWMTIRPARS